MTNNIRENLLELAECIETVNEVPFTAFRWQTDPHRARELGYRLGRKHAARFIRKWIYENPNLLTQI